MEHFYTLQGEGYWSGIPAYFIRVGGCKVQCHWCDVKASWSSNYPRYTPETLYKFLAHLPMQRLVFTGGEPLQYSCWNEWTRFFHARNYLLHLETSGAFPLTGNWDWICLSPKKFRETLPENFSLANELKVVIYTLQDLRWAQTLAEKVTPRTHLFLQPEWSKFQKLKSAIVSFIKEDPRWRISLQIHKFLDIP